MSDDLAASYDAFPYESRVFLETHPDRLATMARLYGIPAPAVKDARILEIGCGMGGNIVPLAIELPEARLVGVDLSTRQIDVAREYASQAGASNVVFHAMSLTEIDADFGQFDYIICHGIYSWIPEPVQRRLMRVCRTNLSPNGVAFISYNTLPGWHAKLAVREMMLYHSRGTDDPAERVRRAREIVPWLLASAPDSSSPYARRLADEARSLKTADDSYILHEFLEIYNDPIYYHQFVDRVGIESLQVFADARYKLMSESQSERGRKSLAELTDDKVAREQYLDFVCDRVFRRSLVCHAEIAVSEHARPEAVERMRISTWLRSVNARVDLAGSAPAVFTSADGATRVNADGPLVKAMLTILSEACPRSMTFEDLHRATVARLDGSLGSTRAAQDRDPAIVMSEILRCYAMPCVELYTSEERFALIPGDRPQASAVARVRVDDRSIPNLRHQLVAPSGFDRLVLRQLDGTRSRDEILVRLFDAVQAGDFTIQQSHGPVTDPATIREMLAKSLEPSLRRLGLFLVLVD